MSDHEERIVGDNLHRRRSITISREVILTKILTDFYQLDCFSQFEQVIPTCLQIGSINKIISQTETLLTVM